MAAALGAWHEPMALARLLGPELKEPREKTPEDLARIAAASERRAKKEAARERQRQLSKGSNAEMSDAPKKEQ